MSEPAIQPKSEQEMKEITEMVDKKINESKNEIEVNLPKVLCIATYTDNLDKIVECAKTGFAAFDGITNKVEYGIMFFIPNANKLQTLLFKCHHGCWHNKTPDDQFMQTLRSKPDDFEYKFYSPF